MLEAAAKYGILNPDVVSSILQTEPMVWYFITLTEKTNSDNLVASRFIICSIFRLKFIANFTFWSIGNQAEICDGQWV